MILPLPSWSTVGLVIVAFLVMEPMTYMTHRYVMHGRGAVWHRSHHGRGTGAGRFERNDLFPVVFATLTITAMALGAAVTPLRFLLSIGVGVTLYGFAYLTVHDLGIHRRAVSGPRGDRFRSSRWVRHLAQAHSLHHRFGGEPYGMLMPVVPAALRRRAASAAAPPAAPEEMAGR